MSTKIVCDNCGNDGAFRVTVDVATGGGNLKERPPRIDADLCLSCYMRALSIIKASVPPQSIKV
jgi:hypothetical protein